LLSSQTFDNTGSVYNLSRIINPDGSFNLQEYQAYSPLFIPASRVISYGLSFASITALIVHNLLYHTKQIWTQSRRSLSDQPDIHARLMSVYKEVPDWWYLTIFCACIDHQC
jgi:OPT oligopeptide transporter protein